MFRFMGQLNTFALGKDNFLAAGDAAGFVHAMGEGISCALTTGDVAGKAILAAEKTNRRALDVYSQLIRREVDYCLDQFNFLRLHKSLNHPIDIAVILKSIWSDHSLKQLYFK